MRRAERIIDRIREETENTDYGASHGISQNECVEWLNDAQDEVFSAIAQLQRGFFHRQYVQSITSETQEIALPTWAYMGHVVLVEYSHNGTDEYYHPLTQSVKQEQANYPVPYPSEYIRENKKIILSPPTTQTGAKVRITIIKRLPRIDIRRAVVSAVTLNTSAREISSLTLNASGTPFLRSDLLNENFLCVVDKHGDLKMAAIPFTAIDAATGVVTVEPGFTYSTLESGADESIAVGDYVVMGDYTVNRSELFTPVERHLAARLKLEIEYKDGSQVYEAQKMKLLEQLKQIVSDFGQGTADIINIPVTNYEGDISYHGWRR